MYQIRMTVSAELADELEALFCEEPQEHWVLYEETKLKTHELQGFFENEAGALEGYSALRSIVPGLPPIGEQSMVEDRDWKEAYKLHFKAWSDRGLHFVPIWERETYPLPKGDAVVYLDPGMAFGTGNHETTRLCIRRILDARDAWDASTATRSVIDAGCGSGILAIAAAQLGFGPTLGFDNDPDSVRISVENAELCRVADEVEFRWCGLEEGLAERQADLVLANILAPVLTAHASLLLGAVAPGGRLALSGILASEIDEVHACFQAAASQRWGNSVRIDQRQEGEWADLLLIRPA